MRIQHLCMWKLCMYSIQIIKGLRIQYAYIWKAWAYSTDIWKACSYTRNVENMKGFRIKYTGMVNMWSYYVPVYEKLLRTIGIYMKGMRIRYIGMWKICACNISIISKVPTCNRIAIVLQVWQWAEGHNTVNWMLLSPHGRIDTLIQLTLMFQVFAVTLLSVVFPISDIPERFHLKLGFHEKLKPILKSECYYVYTYNNFSLYKYPVNFCINTLRTGDADLRF